jgi:nucleotide-binding universal stress UspA family protein
MRKILIPTDFSKNAMNAIKYAMELFKYERSDFIIMHAYADEVYEQNIEISRTQFEVYKKKIHKKSDRKLKKVLSNMLLISPNPRHIYKSVSVFGSLVDEANDIADKENIDVLVMGTQGETNDRDISFGSNTLQVIKYVKCPVLAVPSKYHDLHPKNILFPTDYQLPYQRRELKLISTLAKCYVTTINFLYVSKFDTLSFRQEDNKSFIESSMTENVTTFLQVKGADHAAVINNFIEDKNIDMLVMVNTRHSYLENILETSTIQKIGLKIQIPFLVLQNLPRY